jgi:hypothetical protein
VSLRAPILNLCKIEKETSIYYLPFGINITSGAQRKIFEKGTIFFGHPVYFNVNFNVLKQIYFALVRIIKDL